jgi:hypothetical protein
MIKQQTHETKLHRKHARAAPVQLASRVGVDYGVLLDLKLFMDPVDAQDERRSRRTGDTGSREKHPSPHCYVGVMRPTCDLETRWELSWMLMRRDNGLQQHMEHSTWLTAHPALCLAVVAVE